jgi:esterase/lipase superfamily enzyme
MTRIYFGTNRNPNNSTNPSGFGKHFSQSGLVDLRFGWADVENGKISRIEVADEKLDVPPEDVARGDLSKQKLGSELVFDMVRREMIDRQADLMLYIHGFDYTFREAVIRAAEVAEFYALRPMVMFLFTWPGDGSKLPFLAYASDRDDAKASGAALGRGMQKLAHFLRGTSPQDYCGQRMHLMAHSMGNYALRHAVQAVAASAGGNIRRLFDQALLMAADEDDDSLEVDFKLAPLTRMCRRVTAYINPDDLALVVSDTTKGNPDRLGAGGPRNSWAVPDKVTVVNVEKVTGLGEDVTGHQYYRLNEKVMADVLRVLDGEDSREIASRVFSAEKRQYLLMK